MSNANSSRPSVPSSLPSVPDDEPSGTLTYSLEVRGGRTGFRRRPILGDRFLIGSNAACDLRLDGRLAAPLHCLIHRDGDRLEAEGIGDAPIFVNGRPAEAVPLAAGDALGIGGVRLIVHAVAVRFDVIRPGDFEADEVAAPTRTASRLVELIEEEQERVREFQDRRRAGADALLAAARRFRRPTSGVVSDESSLARLERLAEQIGEIAEIVAERQTPSGTPFDAKRILAALAQRLSHLATTIDECDERSSDQAA